MKSILTLALMLFAQFVNGQNRVKQIDSLLNAAYAEGSLNGNVLIAEKGKVIYQKSFGYANEETKEKLTGSSVFELASCSKQFTAMAIMILKEKGKLSLDDDIAKYIPKLSAYKGISIRNLLNHTGGLPEYVVLMDSVFDKSRIATNKDIIEAFGRYQPQIVFEPNTQYEYSNTGYAILASIVEKASGSTFSDFLDKAIFKPLHMNRTFVYNRRLAPKKIEHYAFGYMYSDSLKRYVLPETLTNMVVWLDGIVGDGCVNSTATDLLTWDRALYTNQLLSPAGMRELFEVATLKDGSKTHYGFGWGIDEQADYGKTVSHGGSWPGYKTYIDRHIDHDKTIIILQNHDPVTMPVKALRSILYNKPLPIKKQRAEIQLPIEQLQRYVGVYELQKEVDMTIFLEKDQLYGQLTGQASFPLFAESELQFFLKVVDAQLQFDKNEKGEIVTLFLLQNGNRMALKRVR